jgi:hypothetical protein
LTSEFLLEFNCRGDYAIGVTVKAIVDGKVVRLKLSPGLAQAWRQNRGKTMTEKQAIAFVERKRREHALRSAKPYLERHS